MRVRYVGPTFGVESLTDGKIYEALVVEGFMLRVIDDSEEDYLYAIDSPGPLDDVTIRGRWEIVEDDQYGILLKALSQVRRD